MFRNLLVTTRDTRFAWFYHGGYLRRRSTGVLNWSDETKSALSKPEIRMGCLLLLPLFAMELPRSELLKLEYVLGESNNGSLEIIIFKWKNTLIN